MRERTQVQVPMLARVMVPLEVMASRRALLTRLVMEGSQQQSEAGEVEALALAVEPVRARG